MKIKKTVLLIIALMLCIFSLATINIPKQAQALTPSEPHNANAMWIEPSLIELNASETPIGYKFNVTVWANSSKQVKGWQIWLVYPNAYINATRCGYTAGTTSEFLQNITTVPVSPKFIINYNATHNRLDFGEAWLMGNYRNPGYGSLCWIEFEIVALPPEGVLTDIPLDIKWAYELYEPPQTYILYADGSKRPLNVYNGLVRFVGEVPPTPTYTLTITATSGGTTNPPPGTYTYEEDQVATVEAIPNTGYKFDHWELNDTNIGATNPIDITMDANYHLHAVFTALPPPEGARIFVDPPEIIDPTLLPSSTFNVNITIDDVLDLKVCTFNLTYNPEVIGWIGIKLYKIQDQFPTPIIMADDEAGYIWTQLTYQTSISTETPTPIIALEFHVDGLGATPLDLKDTEMLNSENQPIDHNATDGFFMSLIRDVSIINVEPSQNWAYQNWTVNIYITVKNNGNVTETFNIHAYYDTNLIGTATVTDLAPKETRTITITWDTSGVPEGNYTIKAEAEPVPYEFNLDDNTLVDGKVQILTKIRDVAIIDIITDNWAYQGWITEINVTVKNKGDLTESFTVKVYYNTTLLEQILVEDLSPQETKTLTFYLNTSILEPCCNYTISAEIPPIPYEFDTTDNNYTYGTITIRVFGDVSGDGYVGIDDIAIAAEAFGATPTHPRWNIYADINRDNYVGIDDLVLIASNFGATC